MGSKKRYTIHDLARELNTTPSTVSRALQDNPRISVKMRKTVKDLADKLNYQPDFKALSLRKGSGRTIGVLIPQVDRHFFATVLSGIDEVATAANYNVLICQSMESVEKENALIRSLISGKVDGLIASISIGTKDAASFKMFLEKGIPLVFFDRVIEDLRVSKVLIDDYMGAVLAVEQLINRGSKHIAHFAGPQHINIYQNRTRGYIDTLKNHSLPIDEEIIFYNVITRETGCQAMNKIIEMRNRPDAIFSSGDYSALGAMICARESGLEVPGDIAVTGFANEPFGTLIDPALTSLDQHGLEMGRQAADLLIEEIEHTGPNFVPRTVVLNPELHIRKSSR